MLGNKLLQKLQGLANITLEVSHIDGATTLFLSRKISEMLIHEYFENMEIKKPRNAQGYPTPFLLNKYLLENKLIGKKVHTNMEAIREKGNLAAHAYDKKVTKQQLQSSIKELSFILTWFLEEFGETDNSLYMFATRNSKTFSKKVPIDSYSYELFKVTKDITTLSLFSKTKHLIHLTNDFDYEGIVDDELIDLIDMTNDIANKYDDLKYEFDPNDYKGNILQRLFKSQSKKVTPSKAFRYVFKRVRKYTCFHKV